jgi:hypothetical protein
MKLLMLVCLWLVQDGIVVPISPPPQTQPPQPTQVDTFRLDEFYFIESDDPLIILDSPVGLITTKSWQQGTVIYSRFAGGTAAEERTVARKYGYTIRAVAIGKVEVILLKAGATDATTMKRLPLTVTPVPDAPIIRPEPNKPLDEMGKAFRFYEVELRKAHKDLAERLRSGAIRSESDAATWLGTANQEIRRRAFTPMLAVEAEAFGGEKWTAEDHANFIMRYTE